MIKIDLITGFLGAGKTTFIKKYASYFIKQGQTVGILENDYGAINVDMMLLQDLMSDNCELEMISGGCDEETHRRRFKTKLISMGMCGYDRVLIEPSGIFDMDEFFDTLHEEPLDRWYEIGNVITIVDGKLESNLSMQADYVLASAADNLSEKSSYVLASEISCAGKIILSHSDEADEQKIKDTIDYINLSLKDIGCKRQIGMSDIKKGILNLTDEDLKEIAECGYRLNSYQKQDINMQDGKFASLYFMNTGLGSEDVKKAAENIFADKKCGNIIRIKGFFKENDKWYEVNAIKKKTSINEIWEGQDVIIVIGENLNADIVGNYIGKHD